MPRVIYAVTVPCVSNTMRVRWYLSRIERYRLSSTCPAKDGPVDATYSSRSQPPCGSAAHVILTCRSSPSRIREPWVAVGVSPVRRPVINELLSEFCGLLVALQQRSSITKPPAVIWQRRQRVVQHDAGHAIQYPAKSRHYLIDFGEGLDQPVYVKFQRVPVIWQGQI